MTEKLQNALNEQITAELWSANLYLSMSFYLEREGFSGMYNPQIEMFAHFKTKSSFHKTKGII